MEEKKVEEEEKKEPEESKDNKDSKEESRLPQIMQGTTFAMHGHFKPDF